MKKQEGLYIVVAFCCGVFISLLWLFANNIFATFHSSKQSWVLISPDGYRYLTFINQILTHSLSEYLPYSDAVFCYTIALPLSVFGITNAQNILFFVPPFFAGVFGIGAYLYAREFLPKSAAFLATLLTVTSIGFVSRLKAGYFDTDIIALTFFPFILTFSLWYIKDNKKHHLFAGALFAFILTAEYANGGILCLVGVAGFFLSFLYAQEEEKKRYIYIIITLAIVSISNPGTWGSLYYKAKFYLFKDDSSSIDLIYTKTAAHIAESSHISFFKTTFLMNGTYIVTLVALIGIFILLKRDKRIATSFGFLFAGLFAFILGARFASFGVLTVTIGLIYFAVYISQNKSMPIKIIVLSIFFFPIFIFNIINAAYDTSIGGFNASEVQSLHAIKPRIAQNALIYSRWDYGDELHYYLNQDTASDNQNMSAAATYIESAALRAQNQQVSAHLLIDAAPFIRQDALARTHNNRDNAVQQRTIFYRMVTSKGYTAQTVDHYLNDLASVRATHSDNLYLLVPTRIINIFESIEQEAQAPFATHYFSGSPFFRPYKPIMQNNRYVMLPDNITFDKYTRTFTINNKHLTFNAIYEIHKNATNTIVSTIPLDTTSDAALIHFKDSDMYIVCDAKSIQSSYVQMMLFDIYDHTLFQKIYDDVNFKVFKLL